MIFFPYFVLIDLKLVESGYTVVKDTSAWWKMYIYMVLISNATIHNFYINFLIYLCFKSIIPTHSWNVDITKFYL